ncbi:MAG: hypothetical protein OHK0040_07060 [bacterium]
MKLEGEQVLFRIFLRVNDKHLKFVPLYRYLLNRLKEDNLAGATVIKGFSGFLGYAGEILRERFFDASHLPVCIEVVDKPEKINEYIEKEWQHLERLILTSERARVIIYTSDSENRQTLKNKLSFIEIARESRRKEIMLKNTEEKVLVRIFIGDSDREKLSKKYLYEFIIEEAKKLDFMLAFSYKGIMGYGKKARLRDIETIEFSSNIPLCVELIGDDEKSSLMLNILNEHVESGLVTVEKVNVYNPNK